MPPEERLSLNSGPPEVSVVLPTGQDGGWAVGPSPEDSEVWYVVITGRRLESYFPLRRKSFPTLFPELLTSLHVIPRSLPHPTPTRLT